MLIIGLMSGTSLDGIDAALVELHGVGDRLAVALKGFRTYPLAKALREEILAQIRPEASRVDRLAALDVALGQAFGDAAVQLAADLDVPLEAIDAIGSHGQTIWHAPHGAAPVSWQLGEPAVIAARTGVTTVGRFRALDVALGGQGAPLVPYVDWLIFGQHPAARALQNLGGIGNVTYLPGGGERSGVRAFDTGPGNMVIDQLTERVTAGAQTYDLDGRLAASGTVCAPLLAELMQDPFLALAPPKSTGREDYGHARVEAIVARGSALGLSGADLVATATAWTAATVADQYRRFLPAGRFPSEVVLSGGGARNPVLVRMIAERLAPVPVRTLEALGFDADAKEALAFAVLAHQTLLGVPNVLSEATGADQAGVLGQIVPGRNFGRVILASRVPARDATEAANPASAGLDTLSSVQAVQLMHAQDYDAVRAIEPAVPAIARAVELAAEALGGGGRLFYVGAGTSGRLGVLDASECPPTFSVPPEWVQGVIAGGERALRFPVEGAEDDREAGRSDLLGRGLAAGDFVVGLSANGGAPYVQGALEAARERGAKTAIVTCNPLRADLHQPDVAIVLPVGPEILAGSTRLKSGTATKLVLNMLSTLAMVRLGKVHDNLMVDLTVSNRKLRERATRLVGRLTGLAAPDAEALLDRAAGRVKRAVVMHHAGVEPAEADGLLDASRGFLRPHLAAR